MPREIEIKLRLADREALRRRLASAGAACRGLEVETNCLFDADDARLRSAGCALRVRKADELGGGGGSTTTLTFKGPRAGGPIRSREELETTVADAATLIRILEALGYRRRIAYEKRRETWTLGAAEITIDELPGLGFFCEIEADSADAVEGLRDRLGFAAADVVPETYVELAARHGVERGGVRVLSFDD